MAVNKKLIYTWTDLGCLKMVTLSMEQGKLLIVMVQDLLIKIIPVIVNCVVVVTTKRTKTSL